MMDQPNNTNLAIRSTISFLLFLVSCAAQLAATGCAVLSATKPSAPVAQAAVTPPQVSERADYWSEGPTEPPASPASAPEAPNSAELALLGPPTALNGAEQPLGANVSMGNQVSAAIRHSETVTAAQQDPAPEPDRTPELASASPTLEPDSASTTHYTDLWNRIRDGFGMASLDDPRVQYHERWFTRNGKYMERKFKRARLYLYHIVEEIERRGMPMEIALLPAIESAYHPHAYSRARAVGLWQFIGSTARRYGLKINWWYDGRRDVVASTTAALNYLEELHEEFDGDWHLALAAYNAGEGKIRRMIERNRRRGLPTGYPYLRLRLETRHYVPKLMAMVNIVRAPEDYGLSLPPIPNEPYFARVDLGSQIDLNVVAKLADVSVGDLYDINPGFSRWATDPNGPHQILVPVAKQQVLVKALDNLPQESRIRWQRHKVRRGDTLSAIARRYRVRIRTIKTANNLRGSLIRVGQNLMIPISSRPLTTRVANITRPMPRTSPAPRGRAKVTHRVRRGETLWSIARRYKVYVKQLARWNLMNPRDILRAGRTLKIWISPNSPSI